MDRKIDKWLGFAILIFIVIPCIQLTIGDFTAVGGIIQVAGTEFELAIWRFWPLLVLVLALIIIFKNIRGDHSGEE